MERPNPFYRRSRISAKKFRQRLRLFALDLTATDAAQLTGLTRKSVTTIFLKIRERIAEECERESPLSSGEVEVDESYFGARRVRGKRGRGAGGKTIVFGLLKREGRVSTQRSCRTVKRSLYRPLSAVASHLKRSSIRTVGAATMAWSM
jgi:transposase